MLNSKRDRLLGTCIALLFLGCATSSSSYRVLFQDDRVAELSVSSERVVLECKDLHDADIQELYSFIIHVLDQENRVTTIAQGNTLGKEDCERRAKGIGKVLKEGKVIYIAATGNLSKVDDNVHGQYAFPGKGTFQSNGRSLGFMAIANERGLCYDADNGFEGKPCPPAPFPLWNKRGDASLDQGSFSMSN